jgi:hypothetical protein
MELEKETFHTDEKHQEEKISETLDFATQLVTFSTTTRADFASKLQTIADDESKAIELAKNRRKEVKDNETKALNALVVAFSKIWLDAMQKVTVGDIVYYHQGQSGWGTGKVKTVTKTTTDSVTIAWDQGGSGLMNYVWPTTTCFSLKELQGSVSIKNYAFPTSITNNNLEQLSTWIHTIWPKDDVAALVALV